MQMNAQDILKYGDSFLLGSLKGVPLEAWEAGGVCGVWSVKDIMAHLISYENMLTDILSGFLGSTQMTTLQSMFDNGSNKFNDIEVAARKGNSPADVLAEYKTAHARNMDLAAQISPEIYRQVGSLPWYGSEYALDDYIVYSFYGHKREHGAQINIYKDVLKAQG
jgi:hypothetical protein